MRRICSSRWLSERSSRSSFSCSSWISTRRSTEGGASPRSSVESCSNASSPDPSSSERSPVMSDARRSARDVDHQAQIGEDDPLARLLVAATRAPRDLEQLLVSEERNAADLAQIDVEEIPLRLAGRDGLIGGGGFVVHLGQRESRPQRLG